MYVCMYVCMSVCMYVRMVYANDVLKIYVCVHLLLKNIYIYI